MSDYNSSLPIRTEAAGDVVVKVADSVVPSQQLQVLANGSVNVNTITSALPTGASTSALQTSGNASLSSIDTKTPALGQALAASSVPVVLTAAQLTTLTPLSSVTVTQASGANLHVNVDNFPATQAISAVSLPLPTGASTSANQTTANASLASIDAKLTAPISVVIASSSGTTKVNDYSTSAAVAAGASSTHTYTAPSTFTFDEVFASASGKMKIEIQVNSVTKFVGFNSTASPNIVYQLYNPITVTSGQTVTIIRTNKDNLAQDVYSTICGYL